MNRKLISTVVTASALLSACVFDSEDNKDKDGGIAGQSTVLAFTSDYTTGALRWLEGDTLSAASLEFNSDSKLVVHGQTLYVLERSGADNLVILDASQLPSKDGIHQVALADASNPMDLVVVNDSLAWIALYGKDYILAIDPKTGKAKDSVDLSEYNVGDATVPYMQSVAMYGDTLLVVLQRLGADWSVSHKGLVILIDAIDGEILDEVELKGKNPFDARVIGDKLYVGCQGSSQGTIQLDDTRSLDVVDLKTGEASVFVKSKDLGGSPTSLAYDSKNELLYVGSYKSWGDMPVGIVDLATGKVLQKAIPNVYNAFGGIDVDPTTSTLYIGDQDSENGGLKAWDGDSTRVVKAKKAMPMSSIVVANW